MTLSDMVSLAQESHQAGDYPQAESLYRQILDINPNLAGVHNNLGSALELRGCVDEAVASYRRAIDLNPRFVEAHFNLGNVLQGQGRQKEAAACYQQAIALNPNFAEAYCNLGIALIELQRLDEALACFQRVVQLNPSSAEAQVNLAGGLRELGQPTDAVAAYRRAWQLEPGNPAILIQYVAQLQQLCLWDQIEELAQRVIDAVAKHPAGAGAAVDPFLFFALPTPTTAQEQWLCASQWARQIAQSTKWELRSQDITSRTSDKLTIGYLTGDFREHATAHLIAELIEKHDRERFAIFGYSYGPDDGSPMRQRLVKAFDRFVDVRDDSFLDAAKRIQVDQVNILVDLKGYTQRARTQILAYRPAPIQVNFLGYPATMAAAFIDYIVVDDFVVPSDQQPVFTEKLIHLPGCYQVNDSQRRIAEPGPSRKECGLPETGFVFACFNNSYKITPRMFSVWMQLLNAVPGSVLWLLENHPAASTNLRREAERRAVSPERLVFARRLPLPDHLARHRLADLVLDTVPVNAHTTASDALWAGCPLLTMAGNTFASRVAGSMLRALGLPELITISLNKYQEMALRLARNAVYLNDLRDRLRANRKSSGLFDGSRFARKLEEAYARMWDAGEPRNLV
jgi:predicted O-linked N-acetylglucosamine transferase (SPINDLY family)